MKKTEEQKKEELLDKLLSTHKDVNEKIADVFVPFFEEILSNRIIKAEFAVFIDNHFENPIEGSGLKMLDRCKVLIKEHEKNIAAMKKAVGM